MKILKLTHFTDPGHGWIAVKRTILEQFGLIDKITPYSYQSETGSTVYLEEDCDAGTLIEYLKSNNIAYQLETKYAERTSIRNYPRFNKVLTAKVDLLGKTIDLYGKTYQVLEKTGRSYRAKLLSTGQLFKIGPTHSSRAKVV